MNERLAGENSKPPLRILLLVDSIEKQPRWVAETIRTIRDSTALQLVGVVLNLHADEQRLPTRRRLPARLLNAWRRRSGVALQAYLRFDARRYPSTDLDLFESLDVREYLAALPLIEARPRQTAFSDFLDDAALAKVAELDAHVAIRFGFRIVRGPLLSLPKYGVWSFHHGDNAVNRGGPAGLWEVFRGWGASGAVLQRLSEDLDGGTTLARTWVPSNPISVNQNRLAVYGAAAPLLVRKLEQLYREGETALQPAAGAHAFAAYAERLYVAPSLGEITTGIWALVNRLTKRKLNDMKYREQWQIGYATDPAQEDGNMTPQTSFFRFKPIVPPSDRFWADPFPVRHQGKSYMFFEELEYESNRGRIAVVEMTKSGPVGEPRVVLETEGHLSYPFMFEHDGEWYMLPEMVDSGKQQLFRATEFPDRWEVFRTFELGCDVVDATLYQHDGLRWLFAGTQASPYSGFNELSLFYADSPLGPWTPHRNNPVVSDARGARPAGQLFRSGTDLIRPAQDGTPAYGTAIAFKRIRRLDTEEYCEELVAQAAPNWSPLVTGTHTINAAGPLSVIDFRCRVRR